MELFTQTVVTKLSKIWVWDPGYGIKLFRIPDPGVKKAPIPNPGSRIRIRNTGAYLWFCQGGCTFLTDLPPPTPSPPPGSGSESGSTSRFWAGSGSCSGSASKQCGSILEIKRLFLYIMIRSKKLIWTSKTAFFHRHIENFLYSLITWLPFSDRKTGSVFCSPPMINCWLFAGEAPWSVAVIL
jgi:hypothetical protein